MTTLSYLGHQQRLARLRNSHGFYSFLAMDHALTNGPAFPLADLPRWVRYAETVGVSAIVCTRGMVSRMPVSTKVARILQLVGLPEIGWRGDVGKVQVSSPLDAVAAAADGVSLQINFARSDLPLNVTNTSRLIGEANALGLPVLIMVNGGDAWTKVSDATAALRVCAELGADLVKLPLPEPLLDSPSIADLESVVRDCPPALLAGGARTSSFDRSLEVAAQVGFAGVCVGRHVFEANDPLAVARSINTAFAGRIG